MDVRRLVPRTDRVLADPRLRAAVGPDLCLIGVGGIGTPEQAVERLDAGATLVQAYTGFIYGGAGWPARVQRALSARQGAAR